MGLIQTSRNPILRPLYVAGGGSLVDGGTYVANSSGLGTTVSASNVEWIGGVNGYVETLGNGANFSDNLPSASWHQVGNVDTVVSNGDTLSGTVSLYNNFDSVNNWQFGSTFDSGAGQKSMYIRAAYKFLNPNNQTMGQVKLFRFNGSDAIEDLNSYFYFTRYYNGSGNYMPYTAGNVFFTSEGGGTSGNFVIQDVWIVAEMLLTPDSTPNAGDGSIQWRHYRADTGAITTFGTITGATVWTTTTSANPFRFFVFQCGFYNEFNNPMSLYIDRDMYFAWNTSSNACPKYVLLGNASTFAACTVFSICKWSAWADTQVTFTINKGQHSSLSGLYIYFMSAPGSPINSSGVALV
jgi:hypothetical protein